ncbi:hypothetical protein [Parageobacillus thermoglucosidasius]|uniref:Lipoprotein n=1 Tax=Parageobacillus thermoglucosidasius TaxID=1426 RepID=A0AAN0YN36_PARTM|nr:hypothetical protein [Parageobacillus thermoglucosidasius]ALF09299.1 hypothetical protein AOT13_04230 [Parageobacillus thermoglucosidasius]ANZ29381.1 hypothetical protein BCV53_04245 [Parageobacillus thermoglucosidasius]APM80120.1 hypothetical protein BCV54_04250 [Parageobacillus thermoglucosidasius]KJX67760.1 hypothetical protein WH82_16110 [Parageobacillus thermoglucosidasius]RDE20698.1 hypothetical protein DV712_10680 [Parageobacillus thermoglucosidasius]
MKRVVMLIMGIVFYFVSGCSIVNENNNSENNSSSLSGQGVTLPKCQSKDSCMILYNRFTQKLLAYNLATKTIEQQTNRPNYVVYEFNTKSNYYTAGDSHAKDFSILRIHQNQIKEIYRLEDQQAIFPLATDGKRFFFIMLYCDKNGAEIKRSIVRLDAGEHQLIDYPNAKGLISYGVIIHNQLYYTAYDKPTDSYSLYVLDLSDRNNMPQLLETGLEAGELYCLNDQLYRTDKEKIYHGNNVFTKKILNYFDQDSQMLIQIYPNRDATLILDVIDTQTKKHIGSATDVIDFSIEKNEIIVYGQRDIKRITIQ